MKLERVAGLARRWWHGGGTRVHTSVAVFPTVASMCVYGVALAGDGPCEHREIVEAKT